MTESPRSTDTNAKAVHDEATASAIRHLGPTADRYEGAMVRYLNAVSVEAADEPAAAHHPRVPANLVADVMTRAVVSAHENAPFKEIVAALARNRISAVPVIDDEHHVVGVVSESDLITRLAAGSTTTPRGHHGGHAAQKQKIHACVAHELMTAPAVTVRAHATVTEAARIAAHARVRHLPVVDRDGGLTGIVTRADLLRVFLRDDTDIKNDIEYYLQHALLIEPYSCEIAVEEGVVTLDGQVDRALQIEDLANFARAVSGVVDVENKLTARYDDRYFPAPTVGYPSSRTS